MSKYHTRVLTGLTLVLIASLVVASYYGVFVPGTYARDSASMGTQGMGQDAFDLFFVTPLLAVLLFFALRGNRIAWLLYVGTLFYVVYSFVIYGFGVHFNQMFLVYCLVLGTSFYAFALSVYETGRMRVSEWFDDRPPLRATAIYFLVIAALFYSLWLKDVLPPLLAGSVPATVRDNDLLVNPVHVLDMAIALPGVISTAVLLLRRHPLGYLFAPMFLVFLILLALAIIAMVVALKVKGVSEDTSLTAVFGVLVVISGIFLFRFLRAIQPGDT